MTIQLTRDAEAFAGRATALLEARVQNNLLATVLGALRVRGDGAGAVFATVHEPSGGVVGAALRTPPRPMLATALAADQAGELIDRWLAADPRLPGVNAVTETARALATAWSRATGGETATRMRMAMHVLDVVSDPPRPAPGALRSATEGDLPLLVAWWQAFAFEAEVAEDAADVAASARARLAAGGAHLWEHADRPVSLVFVHPAVSGVARIGPVYTPPELRRRGYAGSAVAAASRRVLAGEAHHCALFTDLANPTSNKIYAEVGYRPLCEWETIRFEAG